jgi:hypothetical protein
MESQDLKRVVYEMLQSGFQLTEIQKKLKEEHDTNITFLDLRILAAELENIDWSKFDPQKEEKKDDDEEVEVEETGTLVEVNKVVRPGAIANGSVRFASGAKAEWLLTQFGELALENKDGEPTEEDIKEFQIKLQDELSKGVI